MTSRTEPPQEQTGMAARELVELADLLDGQRQHSERHPNDHLWAPARRLSAMLRRNADTITRLAAEVERLTMELDHLKNDPSYDDAVQCIRRAAALVSSEEWRTDLERTTARAEKAEAERDQWKIAASALCSEGGIQGMAERYYTLESSLLAERARREGLEQAIASVTISLGIIIGQSPTPEFVEAWTAARDTSKAMTHPLSRAEERG